MQYLKNIVVYYIILTILYDMLPKSYFTTIYETYITLLYFIVPYHTIQYSNSILTTSYVSYDGT